MSGSQQSTVAYVISIPHGMDAWTYREIETLLQNGLPIILFTLTHHPGVYMPKPEWDIYQLRWSKVILSQPWYFIRHPIKYMALFMESWRLNSIPDFLAGWEFSRQMRRKNIGLMHCVFGDHKFFIGYYCKKILNIPLSVALYGYDLKINPNWTMLKKALHAADTIIVNCDFNKHLLGEIAGSEIGNRAHVVRHYAELPAIEDHKKLHVLMVGGFKKHKGFDVLFQAIKALGPLSDEVEVWVAGYPGPYDVQQVAHDLGVEDKVVIFESIADQGLEFLYRNCDVFCLPSTTQYGGVNEGLPVALIEAMAHAKPVVASRVGGVPELVQETLVEEGDVQGLKEALQRYLSDSELRKSSGAKNRQIVETHYSKQNVTQMPQIWAETRWNK